MTNTANTAKKRGLEDPQLQEGTLTTRSAKSNQAAAAAKLERFTHITSNSSSRATDQGSGGTLV